MKKILIGLLAIGSLSAFAQSGIRMEVTPPSADYTVKIKGNYFAESIIDRGETVLITRPFFQSIPAGTLKLNVLKDERKVVCKSMGFGKSIRSSLVMERKATLVLKDGFLSEGLNKVIVELECKKKD